MPDASAHRARGAAPTASRGRGQAAALRAGHADDTGSRLDAEVLFSEYVGALSVLGCEVAGQRLLVEVNSETPIQAAGTLRLGVDPAAIHFFNPQTEAAL